MPKSIVHIKLVSPDPPMSTMLDDDTWLLRGITTWSDDRIFVFSQFDTEKAVSLSQLFDDLAPRIDGWYDIEFGVILPDLLPSLDGQHEYSISVALPDGSAQQLYLSNVMQRVRYAEDNGLYHALVPSYLPAYLEHYPGSVNLSALAREPLKTVVATRFELAPFATNQELVRAVDQLIDQFLARINVLARAVLAVSTDGIVSITPYFDRGVFPYLYCIVRGDVNEQFSHFRLALNAGATVLNPQNLQGEDVKRYRAIASGREQIDETRLLLSAGRKYCSAGSLRFSLLQLMMAAEIATTRFVDDQLLALGVSKASLDENRHRMDFALMLKVVLPALCPDGAKPDLQMLGVINAGRRRRNDFIHESKFDMSETELRSLAVSIEQYMDFLDGTRASGIAKSAVLDKNDVG